MWVTAHGFTSTLGGFTFAITIWAFAWTISASKKSFLQALQYAAYLISLASTAAEVVGLSFSRSSLLLKLSKAVSIFSLSCSESKSCSSRRGAGVRGGM